MKFLADEHPELKASYHPANSIPWEKVCLGSDKFRLWICVKGHEWDAKPVDRARGGCGCPYCSGHRVGYGNSFGDRNPQLVPEWHADNPLTVYQVAPNSCKKYLWQCSKGHPPWKTTPNSRNNMGSGCPYCSGNISSDVNNAKCFKPELIEEYHVDNLKPLTEYTPGSDQKVHWICKKCNDDWWSEIRFRVKRGDGCPACVGRKVTDTNNAAVLYPHLLEEYHPDNEKPFSAYTGGSDQKMHWVCKKCSHDWWAAIRGRTKGGTGCPHCSQSHTKLEVFTETLLGFEKFDRCPLSGAGKRYRPDIKLSETLFLNSDGLYPHSQNRENIKRGAYPRNYHRDLRRAFEAEGKRILQFYEDEIRDKSEIVKSMVNAVQGKTEMKIGARKCNVVEVPRNIAEEFLDANHLIGRDYQCRHLGLEYKGTLIGIMSYQLRGDHIDIVRSAALKNLLLQGGFQKLLKAIQTRHPGVMIRTLVDLRYADGHSLVKAGFVKVKEYLQYQYTNGGTNGIRKDKRHFRVPAGVDEQQAALDKKWYRIWDAGRAVYELYPGGQSSSHG